MVLDKKIQELIADMPLIKVEASATVAQAARLMKQHHRGAILVEEQGSLRGIFTERDMVFRVVSEGLDPKTTPISQIMSTDLVVGHPQDSHVSALRLMAKAGVRHLPIVLEQRVVGLVSRRQLMALDIELMDAEIDRREASRLFI
jgi:CBS domain-containing protein